MVLNSVIVELNNALFRRKYILSSSLKNILSEEIKYIHKDDSFLSLPIDIIVSIVKNGEYEIELIPLIFNILTKTETFNSILNSFKVSRTTLEDYFSASISLNQTNFFERALNIFKDKESC